MVDWKDRFKRTEKLYTTKMDKLNFIEVTPEHYKWGEDQKREFTFEEADPVKQNTDFIVGLDTAALRRIEAIQKPTD